MSLKIKNTVTFSSSRGTVYEQGATTSDSGVPHKGVGVAVYPKVQPVDLELDENSKNPVANCAVTAALKELATNGGSGATTGACIATKEFYTGNWKIKDKEKQDLSFSESSNLGLNSPTPYLWQWYSITEDSSAQKEATSEEWNNFLDKNFQNIISMQVIAYTQSNDITFLPYTSFNCSLSKILNNWTISCSSPMPEMLHISSKNLIYSWTPGIKLLYSADFGKDENGSPNEAAQTGISHLTDLYDKLYAKIVIRYISTKSDDSAEGGDN